MNWAFLMERVAGIEPASRAWEPLKWRPGPGSELRVAMVRSDHWPLLTPACGTRMARRQVLTPLRKGSVICWRPGPGLCCDEIHDVDSAVLVRKFSTLRVTSSLSSHVTVNAHCWFSAR